MRASQNKGQIFHKKDFNTLTDKIKQLNNVLEDLVCSGLNFKPYLDTDMGETIIPSLNQQLDALIDFISKLLSDYLSPSYDQVSIRSPIGRITALKTVLKSFQKIQVLLILRQMKVR